jgi:hypothetical protein
MQKRYYLWNRFNKFGFVCFGLIVVVGVFDFTNMQSLEGIFVGLLIAVILLPLLWLAMSRGTYITVDDKNNLYNTFFFIKRDVIPLSSIVSLSARHPLILSGKVTAVWNTFYDNKGKLVTKSLISRPALSKEDFRDLIDRIKKGNPKIEITEELLK